MPIASSRVQIGYEFQETYLTLFLTNTYGFTLYICSFCLCGTNEIYNTYQQVMVEIGRDLITVPTKPRNRKIGIYSSPLSTGY